jgi:hypothetical protein
MARRPSRVEAGVIGPAFAIALLAAPAQAQSPNAAPDQTAVIAFVARQDRAWNAADLAAYFASFTPTATFTLQARANDNRIVPYGTSTLAEARAQARRFFAKSKGQEASRLLSVSRPSPSGAVRVFTFVASRLETDGQVRASCARREQVLEPRGQQLRSRGQVDIVIRCPR